MTSPCSKLIPIVNSTAPKEKNNNNSNLPNPSHTSLRARLED